VAVFYLTDGVYRLVEQIAVMGDDDHGAIETGDKPLQVSLAVQVQVVVRLVQQQQVGPDGEQLRQADQLFLAAGQGMHGLTEGAFWQPQVAQRLVGAALLGIAIQPLIFGLGAIIGGHDALQRGLVFCQGGVCHALFQPPQLALHSRQFGRRAQGFLPHRARGV
jgi:hypothetical protein